jgi:hypothetical protein
MALCVHNHADVLPNDTSVELPSYACLLGNILESSGVALSQPDCSFEMVTAPLLLEVEIGNNFFSGFFFKVIFFLKSTICLSHFFIHCSVI